MFLVGSKIQEYKCILSLTRSFEVSSLLLLFRLRVLKKNDSSEEFRTQANSKVLPWRERDKWHQSDMASWSKLSNTFQCLCQRWYKEMVSRPKFLAMLETSLPAHLQEFQGHCALFFNFCFLVCIHVISLNSPHTPISPLAQHPSYNNPFVQNKWLVAVTQNRITTTKHSAYANIQKAQVRA